MNLLIKIQFIALFFLYSTFFFLLIKRGFSFSLGILFGVIYFIFIPLTIFIFTDTLEISSLDFSKTNLVDVVFENNIVESLLLVSYLYSILVFIYFAEFTNTYVQYSKVQFPLKWKSYLTISSLIGVFIFVAAGIHQGGNWYVSREIFFRESGSLGLLLIYSFSAIKIIFIATILTLYKTGKIHFIKFISIVLFFGIFDVVLTGNRIYIFVLFAAIGIELIHRYKLKILLTGLVILPLGYILSIYRHIRVELFINGIPTFENLLDIVSRVIERDPPSISGFLLGISESVNFNVIYEIFHYINFNNALWGETYIKTFVYFIPRSLWSDKPLSITQVVAEWFAPEAENLSLVTTIIGEIHANFYLFGIILLPIILLVTNALLKKAFHDSVFSSMLFFSLGLLLFRMPYSDIILVSIFIFIFYKVILSIRKLRPQGYCIIT